MSYFEFHFLICTMLLCCPFVLFAVSVLFPFVRSICFFSIFFLSRSVSPFICVFLSLFIGLFVYLIRAEKV